MSDELRPGFYWRINRQSGVKNIIEIVHTRTDELRVRQVGMSGERTFDELPMSGYYHQQIQPPCIADIMGITREERLTQLSAMPIVKITEVGTELGLPMEHFKNLKQVHLAIVRAEGFKATKKVKK